MADIIDGRAVARDLDEKTKARVDALVAAGHPRPGLTVILVGEDGASQVYVRRKIKACEKVTGQTIPYEMAPRRPGDPPRLVAEPTKLKTQLGWTPQYTDIEQTVATAWAWHQAHPDGYPD